MFVNPHLHIELKDENMISLIELKNIARKYLPSKSLLRKAILSEPDYLPRKEVLSKIEVYITLLYNETDLI